MELYRVIHKRGYFEVQDQDGRFVLSADTESEAWRELDGMAREWELD